MLVTLSSKGQLIVPKALRLALGLKPGARLNMELVQDKIILEPVAPESSVESLYGKYVGCDLLQALEEEHRREKRDESRLRS